MCKKIPKFIDVFFESIDLIDLQKLLLVRMNTLSEKQRRQIILKFYEENVDKGRSFTVRHFVTMKISRKTILKSGQICRKSGSGGHNAKITPTKVAKIKKRVNGKSGILQRKLCKDFKVSQTTIHKTMKKLGIFYRKKSKVPKVTTNQLQRQKKRL